MEKKRPVAIRTYAELVERFPPHDGGEATILRAIDDVSIVNTGGCGLGSYQAIYNRNNSQRVVATVNSYDNLGNFNEYHDYPVSPGARTPLPGCTDAGHGQYITNKIVGARYA